MSRAHGRRLDLLAFVILLFALAAGTGLRIHAQHQNPNVQHDEAWSYASAAGRLGPFMAAMDGGLTGRWVPASDWQYFWQSHGLERREQDRPGPRRLRRPSAALLRAAARLADAHRRARVGGASAQPGLRGARHPLHLRDGSRARVPEDRGRARGARLGCEPRRGQHLVHRPPVRPGGADDGPPRLGPGAPASPRPGSRDGGRRSRTRPWLDILWLAAATAAALLTHYQAVLLVAGGALYGGPPRRAGSSAGVRGRS